VLEWPIFIPLAGHKKAGGTLDDVANLVLSRLTFFTEGVKSACHSKNKSRNYKEVLNFRRA
jgi:hypothetical protein